MTLSSIPVPVWVAVGILAFIVLNSVISGLALAVLRKGEWVNQTDVDVGGVFLLAFIGWPIWLSVAIGWSIGQWLTTPAPKYLPLPPEIEEKR